MTSPAVSLADHDKILIVDFGSQVTQLIARRVREAGVTVRALAELPIVVVEIALAAAFSFTLIAPLGIPWWVPFIALAAGAGAG